MRWGRDLILVIAVAGILGPRSAWGDPRSGTGLAVPRELMTLEDSLERAVQNHPRLLSAKKDLSIAQTQIRQARSLFMPKVNLALDYVRYRQDTLGLLPRELGDVILETPEASAGEQSRAENLYLGRLGLTQTLWAGGKLDATYRLSLANLKRAESTYETLRRDVETSAAEAFFRLISLKKHEKIWSDALIDLAKAATQAVGPRDLVRLATAKAEIRERVSSLRRDAEERRLVYLQSMGLELSSGAEPDGELSLAPFTADLATALVWAKQSRSDLRGTQIQEEVDQLSVDLSRAEKFPVFLLGGSYEVRDREWPLEQQSWNAALTMNIPIFDGFSRPARIRETRFRADQGRLRRVQLEDQVEMEVRTAFQDAAFWEQEVRSREGDVQELGRAQPKRGQPRFSVSDQADFIRWMAERQAAVVDAQVQLCSARARLAAATGRRIQL